MLIGGQDRGQTRFGLMTPVEAPRPVVAVAAPEPDVPDIVPAAFVPQAPVMVAPAVPVAVAPTAEPAPEAQILYVTARSANVRGGPGQDYPVMGRLTRGEAVLVVVAADAPDGWALVRIEGDGIEGYVAARLLTE